MDEPEKGTPIKVKFSDKRRRRDQDPPAGAASSSGSPLRSAAEEAADTADSSSASRPARTASSSSDPSSDATGMSSAPEENPIASQADETEKGGEPAGQPDYLDDLRRVQADFDNYRKRMLREQTQLAQRASARLVERLLPVLDNFESAIAHGEGGNGVELVYRELRRVLEEEGLTEIPAEGEPFDPRVHEAFEAVEDESVNEPTVRSVLRRGYSLKDQILRPSMVSVARPPEASAGSQEQESDSPGEENPTEEQDAAEG